MTNKAYDRIKWISLAVLPALATLYVGLGALWGLPAVEQVVGTITLLDTVLGILLGTSSKRYQALTDSPTVMGDLVVTHDVDGTPIGMRMESDQAVPIFQDGKLASFRVRREPLK